MRRARTSCAAPADLFRREWAACGSRSGIGAGVGRGRVSRLGEQLDAVAPCLLVGSHNYSPVLIVVIALESLLFIGIGLWKFSREEF